RKRRRAALFGLAGLGGGALAACTAAVYFPRPWLPYHVLTVVWAAAGPLLLAAAWAASRRDDDDSLAAALASQGPRWAVLFGLLTLGLAIRGAPFDPDGVVWSAAPVAAVALLFASLAVWRRVEGWAFAAGLCVNLAVSLVVWSPRRDDA